MIHAVNGIPGWRWRRVLADEISSDIDEIKKGRRALRGKALQALLLAVDARGWDQLEFAHRAGIGTATAWKVLNGRSVSAETLRKVAQAIDDSRPDRATVRLLAGEVE